MKKILILMIVVLAMVACGTTKVKNATIATDSTALKSDTIKVEVVDSLVVDTTNLVK